MVEYTTLCYVNVSKGIFHNTEFNFDLDYSFHLKIIKNYPKYNYILSVEKKENYMPPDFWGESVSSLNVLVGKNGAGKTSFFEFMYNVIGNEITSMHGEGAFYVFRCGDDFVYSHNIEEDLITFDDSLNIIKIYEMNEYIKKKSQYKTGKHGNRYFWERYIFYSNNFGNLCNGVSDDIFLNP